MIPSDNKLFPDTVRKTIVFLLFLETLSFFAYLYPTFSSAAFIIVVGLTAIFALIDFDLAVLVLFAELFVGSQGGYLVSFNNAEGIDLPLRIGLFLVLVGVWNAKSMLWTLRGGAVQAKAMAPWRKLREHKIMVPFVAWNVVIIGSIFHGLAKNEYDNVFFDANGYLFYMLMPIVLVALASAKTRARLAGVFVGAVVWSVTKALFVLYVFSHRMLTIMLDLYIWIRDTRVGEITRMVGDFYRVFFQSHLFAIALLWIALLGFAYAQKGTARARVFAGLAVISATGLLMGFSRSFWFGAFVSFVVAVTVMLRFRASRQVWMRFVAVGTGSLVASIFIIIAVFSLPFPRKGADVSLAFLLGERAFSLSGDAAANSRWTLLPELNKEIARHPLIGSGFGKTVTYTTSDPRLLAQNPTGRYTTYAFEWGYHDLLVKFGLIGTLIYAWFIVAAIRPLLLAVRDAAPALRSPSGDKKTALGAAALGTAVAVIGMLATNVFSPYLNHPLGIGMLMIALSLGVHGAFSSETSDNIAPEKSS